MKAILLAAHADARLHPFSETRAPALMPVANRPAIAHVLDALPADVDEAIVIGPADGAIGRAVGEAFPGGRIRHVASTSGNIVQAIGEQLAVLDAPALILNAADRYSAPELTQLGTAPALLVGPTDARAGIGSVVVPEQGRRSIAAAVLDANLLATCTGAGASMFAATLMVTDTSDIALQDATAWAPMIYPWHLLEANVAAVRELTASDIQGTVEDGATLVGHVVVGAGTVVKAGTRIEGPVIIGRNGTVGPSAYLRPDTVVGNDCFLGHALEIYDSVVFDGTTAKHRSYLGHSVIGAGVNIGCGMITSDYRHDARKHVTVVEGRKVNTDRSKLGAFIGDGVHTGIGTLLYPGRKIRPGGSTLPGAIVDRDA